VFPIPGLSLFVLEGPNCTGKSLVSRLVSARLARAGLRFTFLKEPERREHGLAARDSLVRLFLRERFRHSMLMVSRAILRPGVHVFLMDRYHMSSIVYNYMLETDPAIRRMVETATRYIVRPTRVFVLVPSEDYIESWTVNCERQDRTLLLRAYESYMNIESILEGLADGECNGRIEHLRVDGTMETYRRIAQHITHYIMSSVRV